MRVTITQAAAIIGNVRADTLLARIRKHKVLKIVPRSKPPLVELDDVLIYKQTCPPPAKKRHLALVALADRLNTILARSHP